MNKIVPYDNRFDEISFIYKKLISNKTAQSKEPCANHKEKIESKSQTKAYLLFFIFYPYKISFH